MGRPRSIDDSQLLTRLTTVFRTDGYAGASLATLADGSGLHSASLYHRFAGGKQAMALAVLDDVERQFADILAPLAGTSDPADAVRETARRIADFYAGGRLSCVLETMTLAAAPPEVKDRADQLARAWIGAMSHAAVRAGLGDDEALRRGRRAFAVIEGSLVLARVLDDPNEFLATLDDLPHLLTSTGVAA